MFYPLSAFIAYRYAKSGPSQSAGANSFISFINRFSVAGIALGLTALIIVISVMNGFEGQLKTRILGIVPHIEVLGDVDESTLRALPHVITTMPYRETEAVVQSRSELRGVQVHGVVPDTMIANAMVAQQMEQGRFNSLEAGQYHVILGRALAIKLDARIGDQLRIMVAGASVYTPFGRMPSQRLVTISGIFDMGSQMDDKAIYMHKDDVNRLLRDPKGAGESTRLFLDDAFEYAVPVAQLNAQQPGLQLKTWRERQGPLFDAVKMEKNMMFLMLVLIIAVAAFNIVSALVMVVSEKQGDIAVLQTQGMTPSTIMWIFIFNGLFNGVKGASIGLVLGVVVTLQLNSFLAWIGSPIALSADGQGLPIDMRLSQIITVVLLSLLLCLCASIYPARKAMKTQPSLALQNE
ncbi:lipoprotein-releasing ABC transporter permease subunit [Alteromonas australica]|uniref:lipoprotein-releasing ABC transporter permease subunit n=1 Tax=Alteromonas australica TaxID=589873 RepID=UPI00235592BA|nr:lipoprotein-releasing ABC transporter permease subunit [Alteromonas australica]